MPTDIAAIFAASLKCYPETRRSCKHPATTCKFNLETRLSFLPHATGDKIGDSLKCHIENSHCSIPLATPAKIAAT